MTRARPGSSLDSSLRWVATEPASIAALAAQLGLHPTAMVSAIREGRVFVGRYRAENVQQPVATGAELVVHPARLHVELPVPFVLHEGDGVIAVHKPAGMPTLADLAGESGTLVDCVARVTGRVRTSLHATSRLDRDVSGVVIFTDAADTAAALLRARGEGLYRRRYVALASGDPAFVTDRWTWPMDRERPSPRRGRVVPSMIGGDGIPAASRVRVVSRAAGFAILALAPETGRTHQLRVHASRAGLPLLGDTAYGGQRRLTLPSGAVIGLDRIALHCALVDARFSHHGKNIHLRLTAQVPRLFGEIAGKVGLLPTDHCLDPFEEALQCEV